MTRTENVKKKESRARPKRRARRVLLGIVGLAFLAGAWTYFGTLPEAARTASGVLSTPVVLDRLGRPLDLTSERLLRSRATEQTTRDQRSGSALVPSLAKRAPRLAAATIAAEDERFRRHPGVDAVAVGRAAWADVRARSFVQGGSTLTQQLVKLRLGRTGRSSGARSKLREAVFAVRLDRRFDKDEILSAFLAEAPYGGRVIGAEDAARSYFDTTPSQLSWAQAAYLAALPQRPGRFNPANDPAAALDRQRWILRRLESAKVLTKEQAASARQERLDVLRQSPASSPAAHVVAMVRSQTTGDPQATITTTLDLDLQRDVAAIAAKRRSELQAYGGTNVAVVVLDNENGDVLAWEGSGSRQLSDDGSAINGPLVKRQTGSTIKPFIYGLAFDAGRSPSTVVDDSPFVRPGAYERFRPENYDRKFRGPVSLREALGSSINVPAVKLLADAGPQALIDELQRAGVSVDGGAARHGLALALGTGEINLLDLTRAYASIARGGVPVSAQIISGVPLAGSAIEPDADPVMTPGAAFLVTDVLSDNDARAPAFGRSSALLFPFSVAAKTGTSQDFNDNWVVGYTTRFTVGVWAGNFDRTPLHDATGVTGAGPLFHDVVLATHRRLTPDWGMDRPERIVEQPSSIVCVRGCSAAGAIGSAGGKDAVADYRGLDSSVEYGWRDRDVPDENKIAIVEPERNGVYLLDSTRPSAVQRLTVSATGGSGNYRFAIVASNGTREAVAKSWPLRTGQFQACVSDVEGSAAIVEQCLPFVVR